MYLKESEFLSETAKKERPKWAMSQRHHVASVREGI